MENNNEFNAEGQLLFVEPDWISGKTCLFTVTNKRDYIIGMVGLTEIRQNFLKVLRNDGFVITHDKFDSSNDIVYLIMNDQAVQVDDINDLGAYKKAFDKRIFENGGEKFNYPYSVSIEEYFSNPFFPAVLKNESTNGGKDKFLIDNQDQLDIIKRFYDKYKDNPNYKLIFKCSIFQQLIETPTEHATYMRVLMSASGDVLGASLKYSKVYEGERTPVGILEKHFWDKNSEFYLNCNGMFNYYSDGEDINLAQPRFSTTKKEILAAHGIVPENPCVPDDVLEVAASIASKCNKELGIMCGIDFILDKNTNKWYYLEIQGFPAIDEWAIARGIKPVNVRNIKDYIKLNVQDLEARYEALMMLMAKKKNLQKIKKLNKYKI